MRGVCVRGVCVRGVGMRCVRVVRVVRVDHRSTARAAWVVVAAVPRAAWIRKRLAAAVAATVLISTTAAKVAVVLRA